MKSENINELAKSLAKFQATVPQIELNAINPYFKSKYADLACIIKTVKKTLTDCDLTFSQLVDSNSDGSGVIRTILIHAPSGQYLQSSTPYSTSGKPQDQGSAITYMRRYSLASILGVVADDDDDGNFATEIADKKPVATKTNKTPKQATMLDSASQVFEDPYKDFQL